jgi:uncharacterized protein (DUF2062 family)
MSDVSKRRTRFISRLRAFLWADLPPWKMGLSAAIGAFIAMTPTIGLQTVLVTAIVSLVRGNRGLALLASGIANPWTIPIIFYADFRVGAFMLGDSAWTGLPERFSFGTMGSAFTAVLLGSLPNGLALAGIVGFTVTVFYRLRLRAAAPAE